VLNATFRVLSGRLSEDLLIRLDTEGVAAALYVGGHALLGAALGAVAGGRLRGDGLRAAIPRWIVIALLLGVVDSLLLGVVWRHRGLPVGVGLSLVGGGAVLAASGAAVSGVLLRFLRGPVLRGAALALPAGVAAWIVVALGAAAGGPDRPSGPVLVEPERRATGVKIAILGLDGIDGRLVDDALAEGRLPNLGGLARRGIRGDLRSIRPPKSPVVWTSVATGRTPDVHGVTDFVVRRQGERVPVTSNLRRAPALWNLAGRTGFTVAFVNWYVTWPAEEVAGAMISDRVDFPELDRRVFPGELTAAVDSVRRALDERPDRRIARFTRVGSAGFDEWRAGHWGQIRRSLRILDEVVRHDLVTLETGRLALRAGQPDLTALYFRGNDNTQHLFWKYRLAEEGGQDLAGLLYDGIRPGDVEALAPVVDRYYDFVDELVGEALALLEPDTAILVLSDHGFLANNERSQWWRPNRLLEAAGLAVLEPGGGGTADSAASRVLDPEPPTVSGRRVLRRGGAAAAGDLQEAHDALAAARTDAGRPVFRSVSLGEDERGDRLVVVFDPEIQGDSATVGGVTVPLEEFRVPEGHSGDHRMNGFLLAAGGPFRSGAVIEGARALDIAPTVLWALGVPVARDMEGVPLVDLFDPSWVEANPVRWVESYGLRDPGGEDEVIATEADERIREELRALGYLQ
jgi:predicted AlkP superfamily phosphohydrolase/phosphomutase